MNDVRQRIEEAFAPCTVLNVYLVGSRLYDTATEASDYDYLAVIKCDEQRLSTYTYLRSPKVDIGNSTLSQSNLISKGVYQAEYWKSVSFSFFSRSKRFSCLIPRPFGRVCAILAVHHTESASCDVVRAS
jgi:hypothetical protein